MIIGDKIYKHYMFGYQFTFGREVAGLISDDVLLSMGDLLGRVVGDNLYVLVVNLKHKNDNR
jgi:hypothetical protein